MTDLILPIIKVHSQTKTMEEKIESLDSHQPNNHIIETNLTCTCLSLTSQTSGSHLPSIPMQVLSIPNNPPHQVCQTRPTKPTPPPKIKRLRFGSRWKGKATQILELEKGVRHDRNGIARSLHPVPSALPHYIQRQSSRIRPLAGNLERLERYLGCVIGRGSSCRDSQEAASMLRAEDLQ
jgi:hypothetical protein